MKKRNFNLDNRNLTGGKEPILQKMFPTVHLIRNKITNIDIVTNNNERTKIAEYLNIPKIRSLSFKGTISVIDRKDFKLEANLRCSFIQDCVISLRPVKGHFSVEVSRLFTEKNEQKKTNIFGLEDNLETDILLENIDIGQIMIETISLEIPDYPRIPGAIFKGITVTTAGITSLTKNDEKPFSSLKILKNIN